MLLLRRRSSWLRRCRRCNSLSRLFLLLLRRLLSWWALGSRSSLDLFSHRFQILQIFSDRGFLDKRVKLATLRWPPLRRMLTRPGFHPVKVKKFRVRFRRVWWVHECLDASRVR